MIYPPAIRRALRWYRLGINESFPDDQFVCFWLALEIIAEFQKSPDKVPDKCPQCQSPLYCESCNSHPVHKPYAKQAIRALLKAADHECDDATIERLDKTRNSLLHGSTLKEIEDSLPQPHEQIVDVLGRLVWKALIHQFPRDTFDGTLLIGYPSTYIHRTVAGVAHIQTVVPVNADGDFELKFAGLTMEMVPFGPPQSALPVVISMSQEQYERLGRLSFTQGDHQKTLRRIFDTCKKQNGEIFALVLSTDFEMIRNAVSRGDTGAWQDLFREIVESRTG